MTLMNGKTHPLSAYIFGGYVHHTEYERVLGTDATVRLYTTNKAIANTAEQALWQEVDRLSAIFNRFDPQSELCRWMFSSIPMYLSKELSQVLEAARFWHIQSTGALHVGVDMLSNIWKNAAQQGCLPAQKDIAQALKRLKQPLPISASDGLTPPPAYPLNLNALAKGFIIDRAAERAARLDGVYDVLLNIGGDMRHIGPRNTRVEVSDPRRQAQNISHQTIKLRSGALASSGHVWRGYQINDTWYSHLIDPRNGQSISVDSCSPHGQHSTGQTIMAPDCLTADALATILTIEPLLASQLITHPHVSII